MEITLAMPGQTVNEVKKRGSKGEFFGVRRWSPLWFDQIQSGDSRRSPEPRACSIKDQGWTDSIFGSRSSIFESSILELLWRRSRRRYGGGSESGLSRRLRFRLGSRFRTRPPQLLYRRAELFWARRARARSRHVSQHSGPGDF